MAGRERLLGIMFAVCVGVASGVYAFKEPLRVEAQDGRLESATSYRASNHQGLESKLAAPEVTTTAPSSHSRKADPDTPSNATKNEINSAESAARSADGRSEGQKDLEKNRK
ncbi:hypothetical protein CALVIDRAFT_542913 [Calocera viscosa TUFC12733]|uniref:Uncharacterized protein n=1 Tax=Calocera viscosa (strain TUFC12733) TaxID=1330018 RepID=A0A167G6K8_CALVF|nr:hypothetical protein CALVIDRAFT_542913 [Calocera viscosa TUFC12733]